MANLKSSKKDIKKSRLNAVRNSAVLSQVKTVTKKFLAVVALNGGEQGKLLELFSQAQATIARAKTKGILKANTASRKVSRLAKMLQNKVSA